MILADTREQKPYWPTRECPRMKLEVGDYTTIELLNKFHIERKSMQDLYGSLIQGHLRFRKEFIRARKLGIKLVVFVEGTHKAFVGKRFAGGEYRQAPGETLRKMMETIEEKYDTEFVWCGNRTKAKSMVIKRLLYEQKKNQNGKTKKNNGRTK